MPLASKNHLESIGYDVEYIQGDLAGIPDEEVVSISILNSRVIVTFDSDFGALIFKYDLKPLGVIYFRWTSFKPAEPGRYLGNLMQSGDIEFEGKLTVIDRNKIRQRDIPD